jgi:toxin ParE1/3/4
MTPVVFRPEAEADLIAIALYVAEFDADAARSLILRLRRRCEILEKHPMAGRRRPEFGENFRSLLERPYVLIYRNAPAEIEIVAVLHGAREIPAVLAARMSKEDGEEG